MLTFINRTVRKNLRKRKKKQKSFAGTVFILILLVVAIASFSGQDFNSLVQQFYATPTEPWVDYSVENSTLSYKNANYTIVEVDGGDQNGQRLVNVAVDIGFGEREYWGLTNEHGQLITVLARQIVLQDESTEPVNGNGRYYHDEANVPGTEQEHLDQGHVIADSLGGVANAYNITPQNSQLNRHGDQAYMEETIRQAGGSSEFVATISYPDTVTQTPSEYEFRYTVAGQVITDKYLNTDPEQETMTESFSSFAQQALTALQEIVQAVPAT